MNKKWILLVIPALITGCGLTSVQKQQVSQFASATQSISVSSQNNFKETRDKIIEIERRRLIIRNNKPPTNLDLDGGISATGVAELISVLDVLNAYGKLLNQLAYHDESENLGKAATAFSTSFESAVQLDQASYAISDEKKEAFEGVLELTGGWFIERQKKKSLTKIVKAYTQEVNDLADLLVNDLVLKGRSLCIDKASRQDNDIKTGVIDHYCTSAKSLRKASSDVLRVGGNSFTEREFAYDSYVLSIEAIEEVRVLSRSGFKAITQFKKANNELLTSVENDKFTSDQIKSYAKQVKELNTYIQLLSH